MKGYSFTERMYKLFSVDEIRALKLLEMLEYTVIIFLLVIGVSYLINKNYYGFDDNEEDDDDDKDDDNEKYNKLNEDENNKTRQNSKLIDFIKLIGITILETFVFIVLLFYIRKMALIVPPIAGTINDKFIPYTTMDYILHVAMFFVFFELVPDYKYRFEEIYNMTKN